MSKDLAFFVPYHTAYAHLELVLSFSSFADVHLFVYKWNPARQLVQDYFTRSTDVYVHEFSLETILSVLAEEQKRQRRVVVLLTASINYPFGQSQFQYFCSIQKHVPSMIDVYSTGHCMYGCQSCVHRNSHRLPITFTNYMHRKNSSPTGIDKNIEVIICPSFSSKDTPNSLLSNTDIVEQIVSFSFPHVIKLHPLTYPFNNATNPLFSLSNLEQENVKKLLASKNTLPVSKMNTLELLEHARVLICDSDSSIPFEALYFKNNLKHILVYETIERHDNDDDRRTYFHTFHNTEQLTKLIDRYFTGELDWKTKNSHEFFLEKYDEPDGKEIERLAKIHQWISTCHVLDQHLDVEKVKREVKYFVESSSTQMTLYASGEYTCEQIDELCNADINEAFSVLLENIHCL